MRFENKGEKNATQRKENKTVAENFTLCDHRQPIITITAHPWLDMQPPVASHIQLLDV